MSPSTDRLPEVGAPATEPILWWGNEGDAPGPAASAQKPRRARETTTAEEEIQRFKRVPVVGRLPWRRQYLIVTVGLVLGIAVMIQQAVSQSRVDAVAAQRVSEILTVRQSLQDVQATLAPGASLDPTKVSADLAAGKAAVLGLDEASLSASWGDLEQSLQARMAETGETPPALAALAQVLAQRVPPLHAAAGNTPSPALGQLLEAWDTWNTAVRAWQQNGRPLGSDAEIARQTLERLLRAYYANPATSEKPIWDAAVALFNQTQPTMDQLLKDAKSKDSSAQSWRLVEKVALVNHQLDQVEHQDVVPSHAGRVGIWGAGLFAALCLAGLIVINMKQQRLATLEAQAAAERLENVLFDLIQQQGQISQGNLTALSRVDDPTVGPLAEGINHTVQELRSLVRRVRAMVQKTTVVAQTVVQTTHSLAEGARAQWASQQTNSQEVLSLSQSLQLLAKQSGQSRQLADHAHASLEQGQGMVRETRQALTQLRSRNEEAAGRVRRLSDLVREIESQTQVAFDQAERMEELAIQAALHAERAGEHGRGFRVVARNMRTLAEQAKSNQDRVQALVSTVISDVDGGLGALRGGTEQADDASRLNDLVIEAWEQSHDRLQELQERVTGLAELATDRLPVAQGLEERTQEALEQGRQTQEQARAAGQAVEPLLESVQELGESLKRFQV